MVAFRETFMGEIVRHSDTWGARVSGIDTATNSTMNLGMVLENTQVSSSQRRFILKPVVIPGAPLVTINASVELCAAGAAAALRYLRLTEEENEIKGRALDDQRGKGRRRLAWRQAELEKVQAEIEALKLEERRLVEELDREQKLESELLDARRRAKKTGLGMQGKILDMQRFIETHESREQCPEHEDACIRAAEQMLALAVEMEYDSLARVFIDQAANVDNKGFSDKTALHHAVWRGHDKLAWLLITKGADINSPDQAGVTPLYTAAERGFEDIVHLLFENGAKLAAETEDRLASALRHGIKREHIAKLLRKNMKHLGAEELDEAIKRIIMSEATLMARRAAEEATRVMSEPFGSRRKRREHAASNKLS
jgi:hypothetical protein